MTKVQIATRVDEELLSKIEEVQKDMQIDRSEAIRRILDEGTKQYRLEKAVEQLRDKKITVSKAAELAGVPIWDIMEIMRNREIPIPYSSQDLRKSLELID